jgi:hypothetical protein
MSNGNGHASGKGLVTTTPRTGHMVMDLRRADRAARCPRQLHVDYPNRHAYGIASRVRLRNKRSLARAKALAKKSA